MDEDTKRRHDALMYERSNAWASFTRRNETSWKLSFSIWTALAAFTALMLKGQGLPPSPDVGGLWIGALVVSIIIIFAHIYFHCGVTRGGNIDQKKLQVYEETMMSLTGVEWPQDLQDKIKHVASRSGVLGYWAHVSQVLVTAALSGGATAAVWWLESVAAQAPK